MADVLKAAFMFVAPEAKPTQHQAWVRTDAVQVLTVAVKDYAAAVTTARKLVEEQGIQAIELCGGFGIRGTALVAEAVAGKAVVGAVRFDVHPGLGNVSGDTLF